MSRPFDAALRVQQRVLDDVRVSISIQLSQLVQINAAGAKIDAAVPQETAVAAADPLVSSFAYVTRMRSQRARIAKDEQAATVRLAILRSQAADAYGSFRALESADETYRFDAARVAAAAEQAQADEFAMSAFMRARRVPGERRNRS